ncbi:MAG: 3-deoxy-8-phosphooctulonate synthase [Elusimicrobia bacterium GWA2_69_24]|nr:MAG: 3-deoxy-8-phosphooctulonate synthase [Elusimicrobia bacterium GWA2_69_24]HBL16440.1 3-deoxy-8-phosphooctulonate synthase [Elusimicrobiota bacterium]
MPGPESRAAIPVRIGSFTVSNQSPAFFIAGPCILESPALLERVGRELKRIFSRCGARWALKCSFDKANRSSAGSFRGPGLARALEVFARVKADLGVPFLTDIHEPGQAAAAARVADVLQIPAFLCRQTDLLLAAGRTGKVVNIKKGQFLSPWDVAQAVAKVESTGNRRILLTERGSSFGYANLVVDMRSLRIMARTGYPVVFDATHSCQLPGSLGTQTGGDRSFAAPLSRAAAAVGVAGVFFETHPNPPRARSDAANTIYLRDAAAMVRDIQAIDRLVKGSRSVQR